MSEEYKLQFKNVSKAFPGVQALSDVSFRVRKGTVHALCGENGAGKSTLMKILIGLQKMDSGEILLDGKKVDIVDAKTAQSHGIAMIFQELQVQKSLTVMESMFVNRLPVNKLRLVDWKKVREDTVRILQEEEIPLEPDTPLSMVSLSDNQLLEIVKATTRGADIIIMDEPTSSLTEREAARLLEKIKRLRSEGKTILYISHRMEEIYGLADDVTVMRDGQFIATKPIGEVVQQELIRMMVGRELTDVFPKHTTSSDGEILFETRNVSYGKVYKNISFHVKSNEIVGFAGLVGAGRTEIARGIAGFDPYDEGEMYLHNEKLKNKNVSGAIQSGIVMAMEDRKKYGLVLCRSIAENISLPILKKISRFLFINFRKEREGIRVYFDRMRVKARSTGTLAGTLSGGNQQKVVLAKALICEPDFLILDEPTRGIDVGAKYEIYNLMNEIAAQGKGILFISSELPELIGMCDRIYVIHEGSIAGEITRQEFSQELIMHYASGGK